MNIFSDHINNACPSILRATLINLLLILLFVLLPNQTAGQTKILIDDQEFTIDAIAAIDSLYNRNEAAARVILKPWQNRYPDHPIWILWSGMENWWLVLEDLAVTDHEERFIELMREADFEAGRILRNEPDHTDALVIRAVSNSYVARMHANKEQWITSLQVGRRGFQAHQRLMEVAPDLPDNYFAEGMKYYYAAYVPETYPIVRPVSFFLPDGDREKGMELLKEAIEKSIFARPEATYFLATINFFYENDHLTAKRLYYSLVEQYPDNGYYRRMYMGTLGQLREYSNMIQFYSETVAHWQLKGLPAPAVMEHELTYWCGRAQYYLGDYSSAFNSFAKAAEIGNGLANSERRDLQTLSTYFAGITAEELGRHDQAAKYYRMAISQRAMPEAVRGARERLRELDS